MSVLNCSNNLTATICKQVSEQQNVYPQNKSWGFLANFGHLFYAVNPNDYVYDDLTKVPEIFQQAWPYFLIFILLENVLRFVEKRPISRINDTITSFSHGLFQECFRILFRGAETIAYIYIHEKYHLVDLPWESPIIWYLAAIGVDFCYYWLHRASHEVHILWAQHQVHHSSEDFNLAVGLRQSIFQNAFGSFAYLPLALILPPTQYLTHHQFNLLFQFWIHTEVVETIGPLEYIFNSPKHHRVHHGSNIYCLDKNYGGVLIIWDRIFGTYQDEKPNEEIIYGLVVQQPSFNPLFLQIFYTQYVIEKMSSMSSWTHKLASVFYGPSWEPGKPRLGAEEDKIDVTSRCKYDVSLPAWCNAYLIVHFGLVLYQFQELSVRHLTLHPLWVILFVVHIIFSLTIIGILFDNHPKAGVFELLRCGIILGVLHNKPEILLSAEDLIYAPVFKIIFIISSIFWSLQTLKIIQIKKKML